MGARFSRTTQSLKKRLNKLRGRSSPTPPLEPIVAFSEAPPLEQRQPTRKLTSAILNNFAKKRRRNKAAQNRNGTRENNKPLRPMTLNRMKKKNRLGKTPLRHSPLVPFNFLTAGEQRNIEEEREKRRLLNDKREKEQAEFAEILDGLAEELFLLENNR
jgi:hypothetical protein